MEVNRAYVNIGGTFYNNGQIQTLSYNNFVKAGDTYVYPSYPNATSYTWRFLSGNPQYQYQSGNNLYMSLPSGGGSAMFELAVNTICGLKTQNFIFAASSYNFVAYPNPTNGKNLTIQAVTDKNQPTALAAGETFSFDVDIYKKNELKLLKSIKDNNNSKIEISTSDLPKGIYIIQIKIKKEVIPMQIVID